MAEIEIPATPPARPALRESAASQATALARFEPFLYLLFAGACTLFVACRFYASLKLQTLHAYAWARPDLYPTFAKEGVLGTWSAPLDDVFIHFDFARETARGRPFQWSPGAGYSSGGTSLLYPFVLAAGYLLGFRKLELMLWAAIVACVAVFALLVAARRLCAGLPRAASYLLPPGLLSVGALDWSLFSGMEVALFLALWGGALIAWDDLSQLARADERSLAKPALVLGAWGASVVATRPEGAAALGVLALSALWAVRKRPLRELAPLLGLVGAPALLILIAHGVANRVFTGESTAAGALVKLELNHPFLSAWDVWQAWLFHLKYQVLRVTHYHFSDLPVFGWIAWLLALVPWFFTETRRAALVLWASTLSWMMIVALNGQVRWQNERYTMPAVAWLLLASALGLGTLLSHAARSRTRSSFALAGLSLLASFLFAFHQAPRFREQLWFFGRASRNILDQHLTAGALIRQDPGLRSKRVLVGDAGAIPYASDVPALDVIGLGGFRGLPFARATRTNIAAAVELIERIPAAERPDLLAIYPGWWSDFPLWFGTRVGEVPVRGNVICGGASKVLYRPRWQPLDRSGVPFSLTPAERVLDSVDPADLVNEKQHGYRLSQKQLGYVFMKLLPNPARPGEDLWDAARLVPPGISESFRLQHLLPKQKLVLVLRSAATNATEFDLSIDGKVIQRVKLPASDGWSETRVELPAPEASELTVVLGESSSERALFQNLGGDRALNSPYTTLGIPPDGVAWGALLVAGALAIGLRPVVRARLRTVLAPGLFLPLVAAFAALLSAGYVAYYLRGGPRIVDATSYYLQARAMAHGYFAFPVLAPLGAFNGRFLLANGAHVVAVIFPPGYAALLALGFLAHAPLAVGPLLAAGIVWVSYGLARELSGSTEVARVAAGLSLFCAALRYQTADTMSHGWCAFLLCAGIWSALRRTPLQALASGLAIGWLLATRPVSGAVGLILSLCLIEHRPKRFAHFALGLLPGLALFLAYQRAATGSALSSTQLAYYALADGPPGCFRYGFGAQIGCLFEHGDYVRARLQQGFGLREAASVTLRRLAVHSIDIANAAPLALLCPLGAWFGKADPRVRIIFFGCLGFMLAYAPFYFEGSYPGAGARFFADLLPLEHALLALAIVRLDWAALALPVSLLGFAVHASFGHRALAEREGGRPMFEAETLTRARVDRGLVFVDTDHGFNLGHDPGSFDAKQQVIIARHAGDAHDFLLWQRLGRPPSFQYLYSASSTGSAALWPYTPRSSFRFESEREWPPLSLRGGWLTPDFSPCASGGRGLRLHPSGPTTRVALGMQLVGLDAEPKQLVIGWVRDSGPATVISVRRRNAPAVLAADELAAGATDCLQADLGLVRISPDGEEIELSSSRGGVLDYIELRPVQNQAAESCSAGPCSSTHPAPSGTSALPKRR